VVIAAAAAPVAASRVLARAAR